MYVDDVGQVLQWGEFWKLICDDCGHEQRFPRTGQRLLEPADVQAEVRQHYAICMHCAWVAVRHTD